MYQPLYSDFINQRDSHFTPGTIHAANNQLASYYRRYLMQKVCSVFDIQGAPETWSVEYVKYCIFGWGSVAVLNTDKFGVIPQACGYYGYNVFYRPTTALITNPLFNKTYELTIGKQTELIRLSPDWCGISDMIGHFADEMALVTSSIVSNLANTKLAYVFTADGQGIAESFKKMFDKISEGNPAVFADRKLFGDDGNPRWQAFQQNLKQVYLVDVLQAAEKGFESDFFTQIGVPNVSYEKKERLITGEVDSNQFATQCLSSLWLKTLNDTSKKVNAMFGLSIKWDYNPELKKQLESDTMAGEGGESDELQIKPERTPDR